MSTVTPIRASLEYLPIPFFVTGDIRYWEFQRALATGGLEIVPDPRHPGSHVVRRQPK